MTSETSTRTSTAHVADLDDLAVGDMKMARVGEHRVVVIRTASGVHALEISSLMDANAVFCSATFVDICHGSLHPVLRSV